MRPIHIKLPHSVIVKSPSLLPMLYTVGELVEAVDGVERTLRDWLVLGAPHSRDDRGRIWIHGREFAAWVEEMRKQKRARRLNESEAYCLRCKKVVDMLEPKKFHIREKLTNTQGKCPQCGCKINRGGRPNANPEPAIPNLEEESYG